MYDDRCIVRKNTQFQIINKGFVLNLAKEESKNKEKNDEKSRKRSYFCGSKRVRNEIIRSLQVR